MAVEVFEGNTGDPTTVASQVEKLRERFGLGRVVLVGDRGMITSARIEQDLKPQPGLGWITSLRGPAIRKLVEGGFVQMSLFDQRDLAEITSPEFPGERLIVCRNPLLAEERKRKREELLAATEKALEKVAQATRRSTNPLRGKDRIGLRVGAVLGRFKMGKHFRLTIEEHSFRYERDLDRIEQEAALDGLYVIRTSVPQAELSAEEAVRSYKRLSRVERAFRCLKTMDLKLRPIHHHLPNRVRAHVLICMLAYYVEWHMRRALAPLLFEDHDKPTAEQTPTLRGRPGPEVAQGPSQGAHKENRRRLTGPQLPHTPRRPGQRGQEPHQPEGARTRSLRQDHQPHAPSAEGLRPPGSLGLQDVGRHQHPRMRFLLQSQGLAGVEDGNFRLGSP